MKAGDFSREAETRLITMSRGSQPSYLGSHLVAIGNRSIGLNALVNAFLLLFPLGNSSRESVVCERNRDPSRPTTPAGGLSL